MVEERVVSAVRKIVDVYTSDDGTRYFRISWNDTWEPESHLLCCDDLMTRFWKEKKEKMIDDYNQQNNKDVNVSGAISTGDTCSCGKSTNANHKRKSYINASTQCFLERRKTDVGIQVCRNKKRRKESVSSQVSTESDSGDRIRHSTKKVLNMSAPSVVDVMNGEPSVYSCHGDIRSKPLSPSITKTDIGVQVKSKVKNRSSQVVPKTVEKKNVGVQINTDVMDISLQAGPGITRFKNESSQDGSGIMDYKNASCQACPIVANSQDRSTQVGTSILKSKHISTQAGPGITRLKDDSSQTIPLISNLKSVSTQTGPGITEFKNISCQAGPGITRYSDLGVQTSTKIVSVSSQTGSGIATLADTAIQVSNHGNDQILQTGSNMDIGVQVNAYRDNTKVSFKQSASMTNDSSPFKNVTNQSTQCEDAIHDELYSFNTPSMEDSAVQSSTTHVDQDCQYENSFSEYFDDGATLQKEVSVQFCPLTFHCGVQTSVSCHDECTQSCDEPFKREIGCQFSPRTSSCGVQKNVLGLDKCCQYEEEVYEASASSPRKCTPSRSIEKIITKRESPQSLKGVSVKESPQSLKGVSVKESPQSLKGVSVKESPQSLKGVSVKESPQSLKGTPVKLLFHNEMGNENDLRRSEQYKTSETFRELQNDSQIYSRVTSKVAEGSVLKDWEPSMDQRKGETKMKEIMILTDVPLGLRSNNIIDESGRKENVTSTSASADTITSMNSFYNMERNLSSDTHERNPSASQVDGRFLTEKTMGRKNSSISENHTISASQSSRNIFSNPPAVTSTPLVNMSFVNNNEAILLNQSNPYSTKRTPLKQNDDSTGTLKKVTFMDQMVSLDQLTAYSGTNSNARTPVKRKLDALHSPLHEDCSSVSSSSPKTPVQDVNIGVVKKQKRRDKTKDVHLNDGKLKIKNKTKTNISLEDTSNNDICLPIYEIIPCSSGGTNELEHISTVVTYDNALKTEIAKFVNEAASDGNEINDDFISRYWK